MPLNPASKPRHLHALSVIKRILNNPINLENQLSIPLDQVISDSNLKFFDDFLSSTLLKKTVYIIDRITSSSINGNAPTPLISITRRHSIDSTNCLLTLIDVWNSLEKLILQSSRTDLPEAHELYDILDNAHVREFFGSLDDIANYRYSVYVEEGSVSVPVYLESNLASHKINPETGKRPDEPQKYQLEEIAPDDSVYSQVSTLSMTSSPCASPRKIFLHPAVDSDQDPSDSLTLFKPSEAHSQRSSPPNWRNVNLPHSLNASFQSDAQPNLKVSLSQGMILNFDQPDQAKLKPRTPRSPMPSTTELTKSSRLGSQLLCPNKSNMSDTNRAEVQITPLSMLDRSRTKIGSSFSLPGGERSRGSKIVRDKLTPEPGQLRLLKIRRETPGEPLGVTLVCRTPSPPRFNASRSSSVPSLLTANKTEEPNSVRQNTKVVAVQQVMVGSLAYRDGRIFSGDILVEYNGIPISSLKEINSVMKMSTTTAEFSLLIRTSSRGVLKYNRTRTDHKVFLRCLFTYDSTKDTLLPAGSSGLSFRNGDVLELVDAQDPNWWQVRQLNSTSSKVHLIPSQTLEERRQAFNQQQTVARKKTQKIKTFFRAADSSNLLVRSDLWVYEEVVPWPPSPVPVLLMIGANGVGRRTLKFSLYSRYPQKYANPISDTTDSRADPSLFRIRTREQMESEIKQGDFIEWGTVDGNHYGVRFAAVREVIATGKTAVFDCQVQSVHLLHTSEFNPTVVFVSSPSFEAAKNMMQQGARDRLTENIRSDNELRQIIEESKGFALRNQHLYTQTLVNRDMDESVDKLSRLVARLESQPGWIPAGWSYEMGIPYSTGDGRSFVPGSSTLSGFGINALPPASHSPFIRSNGSGMSTASVASYDSAIRLSRPPSICESVRQRSFFSASGRRLYEKRGSRPRDHQLMEPLLDESASSPASRDNKAGSSQGQIEWLQNIGPEKDDLTLTRPKVFPRQPSGQNAEEAEISSTSSEEDAEPMNRRR